MKPYTVKSIKELKNKYNFRMTKSLGQNFLTDRGIIEEIVEGAEIGPDDLVIEIGPGMGVLTSVVAERARKVIAIEIDSGLLPILAQTLAEYDNIEIINADVLKSDLRKLIENARASDDKIDKVEIIGNLPYYITTPIIMKILEEEVPASGITVMMQKEVADRIKAHPGTKAYGALSVAVQYYCVVHDIAAVPREVFVPQPKVDSTVLRLEIRDKKPVDLLDEKFFFICIRAGFSSRRKTLLNCLTGLEGRDKDEIRALLVDMGIDPSRRAETLSIEEFAHLANNMKRGICECQK
ncbi:MAG: 16S rRNA (adenine(1518)-N(6)/adenine(1519)-N(6))-dimethyltransferase RsmA [Anaerovoracaceae bacterium]|jgi:16S rRNA (adenine1518-N6/adenine1519-N6)-dimethyltransferase